MVGDVIEKWNRKWWWRLYNSSKQFYNRHALGAVPNSNEKKLYNGEFEMIKPTLWRIFCFHSLFLKKMYLFSRRKWQYQSRNVKICKINKKYFVQTTILNISIYIDILYQYRISSISNNDTTKLFCIYWRFY